MDETLIDLARRASERAHAPYSGFRVGAALLASDGSVFTGCNVECSSFGGTVCAERSALVQAVAQGRTAFRAITIYTETPEPTPPCGICRQMLMDFSPDLEVVCVAAGGKTLQRTLKDLLPDAFRGEQIPKP